MASRQGGKAKPLKAPKKQVKDLDDDVSLLALSSRPTRNIHRILTFVFPYFSHQTWAQDRAFLEKKKKEEAEKKAAIAKMQGKKK